MCQTWGGWGQATRTFSVATDQFWAQVLKSLPLTLCVPTGLINQSCLHPIARVPCSVPWLQWYPKHITTLTLNFLCTRKPPRYTVIASYPKIPERDRCSRTYNEDESWYHYCTLKRLYISKVQISKVGNLFPLIYIKSVIYFHWFILNLWT